MTAAALTFDRLAYVDKLKGAGIDEAQARAHADALDTALRDGVATKADVEELRRELGGAKTELGRKIEDVRREIAEAKIELRRKIEDVQRKIAEAKIELRREIEDVRREIAETKKELQLEIRESAANLKVELLRWLIVTQVALASFIFAAIKFVK